MIDLCSPGQRISRSIKLKMTTFTVPTGISSELTKWAKVFDLILLSVIPVRKFTFRV